MSIHAKGYLLNKMRATITIVLGCQIAIADHWMGDYGPDLGIALGVFGSNYYWVICHVCITSIRFNRNRIRRNPPLLFRQRGGRQILVWL